MPMSVRFDKDGRRLADTGHGCGCRQCAEADAPRYERRSRPAVHRPPWGDLRRRLMAILWRRGASTI